LLVALVDRDENVGAGGRGERQLEQDANTVPSSEATSQRDCGARRTDVLLEIIRTP
jgi:hypothetical protein